MLPHDSFNDAILLTGICAQATVGPDRWGKARPQPIKLTLRVYTSLVASGKSDNVTDSVHYGDLTKHIITRVDDAVFDSLLALSNDVADLALADPRVSAVEVCADAQNQFLLAASLGVDIVKTRKREPRLLPALDGTPSDSSAELAFDRPTRSYLRKLSVATIIGVNPPERIAKQLVLVDFTFYDCDWTQIDWGTAHSLLVKEIENTSYLTLESLVLHIVRVACHFDGANKVTISAHKPSALTVAHSSGVEITRDRAFFTLNENSG